MPKTDESQSIASQQEAIRSWIARAQRRAVQMDALAYRRDGTSVEVAISDLSFDGCCLLANDPFEPDEVLIVKVAGLGQAEAEVRWSREGRVGVLFAEHLPVPTALRAARRRGKARS